MECGMAEHAPSMDDFVPLKLLGTGCFGKVMLVHLRRDRTKVFAMKVLTKSNIVERRQVRHTYTERHVLETVSHPFIVRLFYAFQTPQTLHLVLEYCPGGELLFHLSKVKRFDEDRCRFYVAEIVLALEYLHGKSIIYRDLKPDNVLLDGDGHVKLTDFGLSKEGMQPNFRTRSTCGTFEYMAPEVLDGVDGHDRAVDWYALGVLLFGMLVGCPPFHGRDKNRMTIFKMRGTVEVPERVPEAARDLIQALIVRDPAKRLGSGPTDGEEIRRCSFFDGVDWDALSERRVEPPFKPEVSTPGDVRYFDRNFLQQHLPKIEKGGNDPHHFIDFTFPATKERQGKLREGCLDGLSCWRSFLKRKHV